MASESSRAAHSSLGRAQAGAVIRDAAPADAAAIRRIALAAWPATYRGLLDDAFIERVLEESYSIDALREAIEGEGEFLVAEDDGELRGYLQYGEGEHGPELFRLYVDPEHVAGGLGTALLEALNERLPADASYVALVHSRNDGAIRFYERHGFERGAQIDGPSHFAARHGFEVEARTGCDLLLRRVPRR